MIKERPYIKLQEVLSRVLRHPLLLNVDMETAILYTVDFIHAVGTPEMYETKEAIIHVDKHRGELPCDLVSINQVMDMKTHICMRSMTDTFYPEEGHHHCGRVMEELSYKTLNTTIITSIHCGDIKISYNAIPVDENGFPLLIDNPTYLKALELYIKKEVFGILYDLGKIQPGPMLKADLEYAWKVALLLSEMTIPDVNQMEAICRSWTTLLLRTTEFDNGFRRNGNREYIRRH